MEDFAVFATMRELGDEAFLWVLKASSHMDCSEDVMERKMGWA
jgi:hypothetical protein